MSRLWLRDADSEVAYLPSSLVLTRLRSRSHIIVSSRSPLKNYWQDPRVEFVAVDFLEPVDAIIARISPICNNVTHAYFTSYVHTDDFSKLRELNIPLFENFLTSIDQVAGESLKRICLQTGGKVCKTREPPSYFSPVNSPPSV